MGWFSKKKKEEAAAVASPSSESKVNLLKTRVDLAKRVVAKKNIGITTARVALVLDYSGSMSPLYTRGEVQEVVERLLPIGVTFDDNEAIDLFIFHTRAYDIGEVTPTDFDGVVEREVIKKYSMGGTNYAPIIRMVTKKYTEEAGDPAYVAFVVDGDCWDKAEAKEAIIEASKYGIFFQFIGIGTDSMAFLEDLDDMGGRTVDNANFFRVKDISKMSDTDLYNKLMTEFPDWVKEAQNLNII